MDDRLAPERVASDAVGMSLHPVLRPGAPLLRRDAMHLQIGTSPGIVIDDRPGLTALLRLLDGARDVRTLQQLADARVPDLTGSVAEVLAELVALGAVVDGIPRVGASRRRSDHAVGFGTAPATAELTAATRAVLSTGGIRQLSSTEPDLLVITSYGEPPRTVFEHAVLLGRDHLPVVIDEDRVRIGPFVRPGKTPCVGCHDLHRTDWDPAWPALLAQLGHAATPVGPPVLDPLTVHAAAVEIAAEVFAHADGAMPRTNGQCLVIGPSHAERAMWPIAFHHRCTCDLLVAA